jgi:choline-glycine betaine transporter
MQHFFGLIGAVISAAASAIYIKDMFTQGARPNRVSFLMWGIAPLIAAAAAFANGGGGKWRPY